MTKHFALLLVVSALVSVVLAAEVREVSLSGTINKTLKVRMNLKIDGTNIAGSYYYEKSKIAIPLKGRMDKNGDFEIQEFDPKGKVTGSFRGHHMSILELEGTWSAPGSQKNLVFALSADPVYQRGKSAGWAGEWNYVKSNQFHDNLINIANEHPSSVDFAMYANSGSNVGQLEGTARLSGNTAAWADAESGCKVTMTLQGDALTLKTNEPCEKFCGMGAAFYNGEYKQSGSGEMNLVQLGVLDNASQETQLQQLTGEDYDLFLHSFDLISDVEDLDKLGVKGVSGGVRGLFTEMEAIVLYRPDGKMWAAAIDTHQGVVKYFTNDPAYVRKLPKTVDNWRREFSEKKVLFMNAKG